MSQGNSQPDELVIGKYYHFVTRGGGLVFGRVAGTDATAEHGTVILLECVQGSRDGLIPLGEALVMLPANHVLSIQAADLGPSSTP